MACLAALCRACLVPRAGVEPARRLSGKRRILSPLCLPISPSRRAGHCKPKTKQPRNDVGGAVNDWRREPESNRSRRICNPLHNRFAIAPWSLSTDKKKGSRASLSSRSGAGKESRTLDLNLGKVALYQLSYSRVSSPNYSAIFSCLRQLRQFNASPSPAAPPGVRHRQRGARRRGGRASSSASGVGCAPARLPAPCRST